jgi:hypothetical protein
MNLSFFDFPTHQTLGGESPDIKICKNNQGTEEKAPPETLGQKNTLQLYIPFGKVK